jgi:TPR repeat protein
MQGEHARAFPLYRQSAEMGDAYAQFMLGSYYQDGLGVGRDDAQAIQWYQKAADQGHILAQTTLGIMQLEMELE